jgi:hypothetical protein
VFLVAAAAAAGHLGRGVHHHRGRAGWCVGTGGIAESRVGIERGKLGSVSRDSSGWIARPRRRETRGVARTSRHDGVRSAIRERRVSRRGPGGPLDGTNEGRPGVDCRGPKTTRETTARRECVRARGASAARRATGARFDSLDGFDTSRAVPAHPSTETPSATMFELVFTTVEE